MGGGGELLRLALESTSIRLPALTAMPQFAVFFADGAGLGIARELHRRAALPPPVDLRFGPGVAEVLTSLAGMQSC